VVIERIRAMLRAGTIRRVRQTLLADEPGAGRARRLAGAGGPIDAGFEYLFRDDPFSGHVVIRSTDGETPGSKFRLWTTLKVPQGFSLVKTREYFAGPDRRATVPPHVRQAPVRPRRGATCGRKNLPIGSKSTPSPTYWIPQMVTLSPLEWRVITA
jgi:hypothetical protein